MFTELGAQGGRVLVPAISFCAPDERHKLGAIISVAQGLSFKLDGTLSLISHLALPQCSRRRPPRTQHSSAVVGSKDSRDGDRRKPVIITGQPVKLQTKIFGKSL